METDLEQKLCAKCIKPGCIAMCYGCELSFCTRHFIKHRLQLATEMANVHQNFDLLQRDLHNKHEKHPVLLSIDAWEEKSIRIIQEIADRARQDCEQYFEKRKSEMKNSMDQIDEQLRASEQSDNYTEVDLQRWMNQITASRNVLENPTTIIAIEDQTPLSSIRSIKIIDQIPPTKSSLISQKHRHHSENSSNDSVKEHFVKMFGPCELLDDGLVVTHVNYRGGLSQISGFNHYSSGRHLIKFLIEKKGSKNLFLGIMSASPKTHAQTFDYSLHGWWNFDHPIINGESQGHSQCNIIQSGDQLTLVLDCDQGQIHLEHHRTKTLVHLSIKLDLCPLPWKVLVRLLNKDDRLCLLS